jgi:hypothetical protein
VLDHATMASHHKKDSDPSISIEIETLARSTAGIVTDEVPPEVDFVAVSPLHRNSPSALFGLACLQPWGPVIKRTTSPLISAEIETPPRSPAGIATDKAPPRFDIVVVSPLGRNSPFALLGLPSPATTMLPDTVITSSLLMCVGLKMCLRFSAFLVWTCVLLLTISGDLEV